MLGYAFIFAETLGLLSHPEQQDTVQRINQAYAPGNSPMRMDQHAPTFPL